MIMATTLTGADVTEAEVGMDGMIPKMRVSRLDARETEKGVGAQRGVGKGRTGSQYP